MNDKQLRAILQSDFKLWEQAELKEEGGVVTKTTFLPHGIGKFELAFEGINNAEGRRSAAAIWGQSIRDAVEDAVGDASVTARAAQKAAGIGSDDGEDGGLGSPSTDDAEATEVPETDTVSTFSSTAEVGADTSSRLDELRAERDRLVRNAKRLDLEIKALAAYMEVINASEVSEGSDEEDG